MRILNNVVFGLTILVFAGLSSAHDSTPEWVKKENLDNGMYVEVDSPWVIRKSGVFPLSVKVLNVCSKDNITSGTPTVTLLHSY